MQEIITDVIIAGAGPAGATMALMLAGAGMKVTVVEKDRFPRGKVCGDALSGKVVSILKRMPGDAWADFVSTVPKTPSTGIRFISPGLCETDLIFPRERDHSPAGYICPRREFDSFLASRLKDRDDILLLEGEKATGVEYGSRNISLVTENYRISGNLLAGADGVHSVVRRALVGSSPPAGTLCTGIRAYYKGVTGFREGGLIELFFLRDLLPFYFWIFPEANGLCNVGFALTRKTISKNRISMMKMLEQIIHSNPLIAPRFVSATMTGKPEAHSLPLGLPPGPFSGDRVMLLGDAAALVDPFTGEGIGQAMASGEVAARVVRMGAVKKDFSARSLQAYDYQLRHRLGKDFRMSAVLHRLAGSGALFDLVVRMMNKNRVFRGFVLTSLVPK
jgi:menaquinone-9 beta-reductase